MKKIFENKKAIIITVSAMVVVIGIIAAVLLLNGNFSSYSSPTIEVGSVEGESGKEIKVPVKVYKNPGVMGYVLNFEYDDSLLSYQGYDKGDVLTNYQFSTNNGVLTFVNLENDDIAKDGVMFYLKFKVLKNDTAESEIKINLTGQDAANIQEKFVVFEGKNGTVTIK